MVVASIDKWTLQLFVEEKTCYVLEVLCTSVSVTNRSRLLVSSQWPSLNSCTVRLAMAPGRCAA